MAHRGVAHCIYSKVFSEGFIGLQPTHTWGRNFSRAKKKSIEHWNERLSFDAAAIALSK
jgi:hypothetical protein